MDPIQMLIDGAVQYEVLQNKNPYLTMETMILRLYKKISSHTRVAFGQSTDNKTVLFSDWHDEILNLYESVIKSSMSHEERASVERVLSKDSPHPSELTKFACCWYKHDPSTVCRWFAVDGIIGFHPKMYVQDAFSNNFARHNEAVRALYDNYPNPENVRYVVEKALGIVREGEFSSCPLDIDPDFEKCVGLYVEMVGSEEMERVASDRRAKLQSQKQQQQPGKRKKKNRAQSPPPPPPTTTSPRPISPLDSPPPLPTQNQ